MEIKALIVSKSMYLFINYMQMASLNFATKIFKVAIKFRDQTFFNFEPSQRCLDG